MSFRLTWLGAPIAAASALLLFAVQVPAPPERGPHHQGEGDFPGVVTSGNWAGLAVAGGPGEFRSVRATWTVPRVTCSPGETSFSIHWVGLDGYRVSNTVEQIGTESSCHYGSPAYDAWYELVPSGPKFLPPTTMPVAPGDRFTATVKYEHGVFELSLLNHTEGVPFTTRQSNPGAQRATAEVIVEAPGSHGRTLPLSQFGKVVFTGATVNDRALGEFDPDRIVMTDAAGQVIADTQVISERSFSVRRVSGQAED